MSNYILILLCLVCNSFAIYDLNNSQALFDDFVIKYNKVYATDEERAAKYEIFRNNLVVINEKNSKTTNALYDINRLSDLNKNELLRSTGFSVNLKKNLNPSKECEYVLVADAPSRSLPASFDWRANNAVTPVKNQLDCGSCWAFSTIANIESLYAIKYGVEVDLAEQYLLNCDYTNNNCNGGLMHWALENILINDNGGVVEERHAPYVGEVTACDKEEYLFTITNCKRFNLVNEHTLQQLLIENGPISVAIDVFDILDYKQGISDNCRSDNGLNHAVLLVGYGVSINGIPYWVFKNSWGDDWGEQGFFRVRRDINSCGMMNAYAASAVL
ncbi:V-CATH [Epinotia aporema granulovirus]|uniref:Viral cathepsin n=1 Tax=Epinotia aporema granulovirus TaxID=166056 RepID=K4EQ17_9BBAC|nr:V-CATH [Epinotia aporema granulovirus]AER41457.1 V-CATH [Epinotia aporema granulovirus]